MIKAEANRTSTKGRFGKRRAALTAVAVFAVAVICSFGADAAFEGGRGGAALAAAAKDPMSLFAKRSPGKRGAGALLSTKPGHAAPLREGDTPNEPPVYSERIILTPDDLPIPLPGAGGPPAPSALTETGVPPTEGGDVGFPIGDLAFPLVTDGGGGGVIGGPPGSPPGGGCCGGGVVEVPPGVPEPATWAMLILGFFGIGAALRRRQAAAFAQQSLGARA